MPNQNKPAAGKKEEPKGKPQGAKAKPAAGNNTGAKKR